MHPSPTARCRGAAWWRAAIPLALLATAFAAAAPASAAETVPAPPPGRWISRQGPGWSNLWTWADTCNVYVFREGDKALLIDLGDGEVLDHLAEIGVRQVEWVLFTHHHREQCQGFRKLAGRGAKLAAPEAERALFERPTDFRKMKVRLGDAFTIHGSSYVRPPVEPIPLDRTFKTMDTFTWGGLEFWCLDTRGNSPGSMSYLLRSGEGWLAFAGDVMLDGARMHTWPDTEWDYGFAAGIQALHNAAGTLAGFHPAWMLPSHGPAIRNPQAALQRYLQKLRRLERLYLRGYPVGGLAAGSQDRVSTPSPVPHLWQISPHLFKFRGPDFWPNFSLILADSGHALAVDCGLLDEAFLEKALQGLKVHRGLKQVDAVIVTHMHGDHFLEAPWLRRNWGAQAWGLDRMAEVCEHPERFDYAAPVQAYGKAGLEGLRFDRLFRPGDTFRWEGMTFTVDWLPGQTEFGLCLHGKIDGRKVAFTGDNIFGDPEDPAQSGHEAVVAHNSAVLEEGYLYAADYLRRLQPDLLVGGHSFVMDRPSGLIHRFQAWAGEMREAFQGLSSEPDYRPWFDPFWVRAEPCRLAVKAGAPAEVRLHLRNHTDAPQDLLIRVLSPPDLGVEPALLRVRQPPGAREALALRLTPALSATNGIRMVAFDVTVDGRRLGERFDMTVQVEGAAR